MKSSTFEGVFGQVLALLVGLVFLVSGGTKLAAVPAQVQSFARWGFPEWFMYGIGLLEVLGAVLLVIPVSRIAGAALLLVVMIGAVATHTVNHEIDAILPPIVLGCLMTISALIAFVRPPRRR